MDEKENAVVDEEMTDVSQEINQGEQDDLEVGAKETEFTEPSEAESEELSAEAEEESEPGQSDENSEANDLERNAMQAANRRERERREEAIRKRIEKESYRKGIVDAVGGVNPYTKKPITDDLDVEELLIMREIERKGGDPIADYAEAAKAKQRENKAAVEGQSKAAADLNAFRQAYPNVDPSKLFSDERFARFAGKRINGGEKLVEVYADYISFTGEVAATAERKAEMKARNNLAKKNASPGSLTGGGGEAKKVTYENMTDEAFERAIAKAKAGDLKKS